MLCFSGFGLLIALYSLVLFVLAVSGAENLTTGKTIATVLLPTILAFALGACFTDFLAAAISRQFQ